MAMSRLLPAILLLGGGAVAVKGGGDVGREVLDTVKTVMTRYELSEAARHLELDATLGNRPPRTTAELATWLADNHRARFGRDPASDLWRRPYRLHRGRRGRLALISLGANGVRDACASSEAAASSSARRGERGARAAGAGRRSQPSARDDDICSWVAADGADPSVGIGDRRHQRDSPFRQLRREDDDER